VFFVCINLPLPKQKFILKIHGNATIFVMHRNVIFTFGFIIYFMVMAFALLQFGFGIVSAAVLMLGVPIYTLAHYSAAPRAMIITVSCFAIGMGLLLEGLGHMYGLWSLASEAGTTLPGGLTLEVIIITAFKVLFLILFYELLFDDGEYSIAEARSRLAEFGLFTSGAIVLVSVFYIFYDRFSMAGTYYWLTIILLLSSVAMLTVQQVLTPRLINKILVFAAVAVIPMLCIEYLLLGSGHKVITTLLHPVNLPLFAGPIPLGELLMAFSVPVFVSTIYELYLDDRA